MSQKDTQTEKKLSLIKEVFQNIKNDRVTWDPVIKAAENYSKALKSLSMASRQFYDTLGKVGEQAAHANGGTNDLGVGIQTMCEHFKQLEKKRDDMSKSLIEDLSIPLDKSIEAWKKDAMNIEKEYQKESKKLSSEIKDAEKDSQKAGKKGQNELKKAIEMLNSKVKEMETLRQNTLRNGIVEERKRYCFFIMHFATVIGHEMNLHEQAISQVKTQMPHWTQLAVSPEQLPPEIQQLVEVQQRTFVSVQSEGSFNVNVSSYYDDSEYDIPRTTSFSSNYGGSVSDVPRGPPPSNSYVDDVIRVGDQVRALYSYSGDSEKLSFREGDVINVNEVDPSGWCLGEIYGSSGWFPSNYVEKIKKAPAPTFTPPAPTPSFSAPPPVSYSAPAQQSYVPPPAPKTAAKTQPYSAPPPPSSYSAPAQQSYAPPPPAKAAASVPPPPPKSTGGPAPPPPPPASSGAPPPPGPPPPVSSGSGDRGALLSSIQSGTKLKKAVTNDRSSPKFK